MDFLAVVTSISTSPKGELQSLDWLFLGEIYGTFSHGFSLLKYRCFPVNILNHPSDSKMGDDQKWILTWFNHFFHHPSDSNILTLNFLHMASAGARRKAAERNAMAPCWSHLVKMVISLNGTVVNSVVNSVVKWNII